MKVHAIYKKIGKTPLEALTLFRKKKHIPLTASLTYAGRLDPMAEGILLILENASQLQKEKYLALPKIYQAEILFGFSSDTFDILGIPKKYAHSFMLQKVIKAALKTYIGVAYLTLPAYASPPIQGKPLFQWAREGRLEEITIPTRAMKIKRITYRKIKVYPGTVLLKNIQKRIKKVNGDFRQEKIINHWQNLLQHDEKKYYAVQFVIACEAGTYVRSLADAIGKKLETHSILYNLKRLNIGTYSHAKAYKFRNE